MIYFIEMPARERAGAEMVEVVKIGFSDNFKKRLGGYITHNMSFEVVKTLDDSDFNMGCEAILHGYLKDKMYKNRGEVFIRDPEVDRLIKDLSTVEDILRLCSKIKKPRKNTKLYLRLYKPIILYNWDKLSKVFNGKPEDIIISMLYYRVSDIKKHVKDLFGIYLQDIPEVDQRELEKFFKEYKEQGSRQYKLKYLCEYCEKVGNLSILQHIEEKRFCDYINILGLKGCKSDYYNVGKLDNKLKILSFDRTKIKGELSNVFEVGQSYTKADIKEKLSEVYKKLGYKAAPKATDLSEYFEMKECLVNNGNKRSGGFKILSQK